MGLIYWHGYPYAVYLIYLKLGSRQAVCRFAGKPKGLPAASERKSVATHVDSTSGAIASITVLVIAKAGFTIPGLFRFHLKQHSRN